MLVKDQFDDYLVGWRAYLQRGLVLVYPKLVVENTQCFKTHLTSNLIKDQFDNFLGWLESIFTANSGIIYAKENIKNKRMHAYI